MVAALLAIVVSFLLMAGNLTSANAQLPDFKDLTNKLKEIPDRFKEIPDKAKEIPDKLNLNRASENDGSGQHRPQQGAGQNSHKVDINSASLAELKTLPGIDDVSAEKIVKGRPYKGTGELETRNILPRTVYEKIAMRVTTRSEPQEQGGAQPHRGSTGAKPAEECTGARLVRGCGGGSPSSSAPVEVGSADFAALRKAADRVAAGVHSGLKLWRVDLDAWFRDGALLISRGIFHYFLIIGQLPTDHEWVSAKDVSLIRVDTMNARGMHLPQAHRTDDDQFMVDRWQLVAVPESVRAPEPLLAALNRSIGPDPANGPLKVRLLHVGDELSTSPRYRNRMPGNLAHLGLRGFEGPFFVRTAPHGAGTWIWWTVMEQERMDPAANPYGAGRAVRAREFIYVDAMTGAPTSRCMGSSPSPIAC